MAIGRGSSPRMAATRSARSVSRPTKRPLPGRPEDAALAPGPTRGRPDPRRRLPAVAGQLAHVPDLMPPAVLFLDVMQPDKQPIVHLPEIQHLGLVGAGRLDPASRLRVLLRPVEQPGAVVDRVACQLSFSP